MLKTDTWSNSTTQFVAWVGWRLWSTRELNPNPSSYKHSVPKIKTFLDLHKEFILRHQHICFICNQENPVWIFKFHPTFCRLSIAYFVYRIKFSWLYMTQVCQCHKKNLYGPKIWHHLWTFPCKTVEGEKESMHFRPSLFAASKPLVLSFQARNWQYSTTCCQLKIGFIHEPVWHNESSNQKY